MWTLRILLFIGPWLVGQGDAPGPDATTAPYRADSTREMAKRLFRLNLRFETGGYITSKEPFFKVNNPWDIPLHRKKIEVDGNAPGLVSVHFLLARELLWDGRTDEAVGEFEGLDRLLRSLSHRIMTEAVTERLKQLQPWLAVAFLRQAQEKNRIAQHNAEASLFPPSGGGAHSDPTAPRDAIRVLTQILEKDNDDLMARWLLNLSYVAVGDYPGGVPEAWRIGPRAFQSEYDIKRFPDVATPTRTDVDGLAGGSIVEDFDRDGLLDIVTSSWGVRDQLRLLRNKGDGTFDDVSARAGLSGEVGGLNLTHADYDNDGYPDIFVLRGGWLGNAGVFPNSLLRNNGDGTFDDVTREAGLYDPQPGQTAAWADYDNDGLLDLFVGNETNDADAPHPCRLYHNNGDGTFTDVAPDVGLAGLGWVKGAAWGDLDNDRWPDLYVSRMVQPNLLFRNLGPGTERSVGPWKFMEVASVVGVQEPRFSFAVWFWDYDNDGLLDLFAGSWDGATIADVAAVYLGKPVSSEFPRLYHNDGDGLFRDVTHEVGLDRVLLTTGANFGDLDNDGFLDLYVGTGAANLTALVPNRMFRNDAGRRFQDVTTSGGFGHLRKANGVSFADMDNDGDQDVYVCMGGWYTGDRSRNVLFENPGHGNHWITLRLVGVQTNRFGVGARIHIVIRTADGKRHIHRAVGTGGSLGSSSLQQEIGLGRATSLETLEVFWPTSRTTQVFRSVPMDRVYRVVEGESNLTRVPVKPLTLARD